MHGVIFLNLRSFTEHKLERNWQDLLETTGLGSKEYSLHDTYPIEDFEAIIRALSQAMSEPEPELIESFGFYLAPRLLETAFFLKLVERTWKTFDVLEALAARIHMKLKDLDPAFDPPNARGVRVANDEMEVYYRSDNQLCILLKGIIFGLANHYNEGVSIEEQECTSRGDSTCKFIVKLEAEKVQASSLQDLFRMARDNDSPLHAYNVYKGVSVTGEVRILKVVRDQVLIRVSQYQAVSMKLAGSTHLKSPLFARNVAARVHHVNIQRNEVTLHRFSLTDSIIGERHATRVMPLEKVEVKLYLKSRTVRGRLADISEEGAGISITERLVAREHVNYFPKLAFTLPERYFKTTTPGTPSPHIQLQASICGIYREKSNNIVGLSFKDPPSEIQALLNTYITQRQMEITREFQLYT